VRRRPAEGSSVAARMLTPAALLRRRCGRALDFIVCNPLTKEHLAMNTQADLPHVDAELNYLAPTTERPRNYTYEPPVGVARNNTTREAHRVTIHSARPIASDISLDREGFAVLRHASEVRDFYDEDELRRVYYAEAERLIADATGASKVFVFDHTVRRRV